MILKNFFEKYEFLIPLLLFSVFLALTLPGISWGAPNTWHPDEVVVRSINALHGEWQFSEINFDYPDLPQYAMFWLGKIILALGYTDKEVLIASRVLSATLAGLTVVLTYLIARRAGSSLHVAGLSGLFLICVSEMEHNARFAHNDTYIVFFATLTVLFLIEYLQRQHKAWLYAAFMAVGMAASSKYIGGSLFILPMLVYFITHRKNLFKEPLSTAETVFAGTALTFLGFAFGTPKALFWMTYYFKRVLSALQWQVNYNRQPDNVRGFIGQYGVIVEALGWALALLFGAAFLWACWRVINGYRKRELGQASQTGMFALLLAAILVLDLPMLFSYNYQIRYFLTLMPLLAVLAAFFSEHLYREAEQRSQVHTAWVAAAVSIVVLYSLARVLSVMLLVMNDTRVPASAFVKTLPLGTSLEYTYYPPDIPGNHFEREHNYPIYFVKTGEAVPTSKRYEYNVGEIGLNDRQTTYLVTDSFTYARFSDPYICASVQVECDFFKQLDTGQSDHYTLIAEFSYTLPPWLPQIEITFINPTIRVYERMP